jgi:hypothetical protein
MPELKKPERVGRFFWKNLEAKPLNIDLVWLRFIKIRCKGQAIQFTRPLRSPFKVLEEESSGPFRCQIPHN